MASKRLLLLATDTYKLSSLLLRRVIFTKPATLTAYRGKTRQLLLDQSQSSSSVNQVNVAAVKILELDKELNLMQYYGLQEYSKRWWGESTKSWSSLQLLSAKLTGGASTSNPSEKKQKQKQDKAISINSNSSKKNNNVARVAFMITSEQRHKLSTKLGYTPQDIRTFKPIEALLLLEHGVAKETNSAAVVDEYEYDFRVKLKELVDENEKLTKMENEKQQVMHTETYISIRSEQKKGRNEDELNTSAQQSVTPEGAQQFHAKPDVAMALLSADENTPGKDVETEDSSVTYTTESKNTQTTASATATADPSQSALAIVEVTPDKSEEMHMKPDIAAAILGSQHLEGHEQKQQFLDDRENEEVEDDGPCWFEVVEKLPTAKPVLNNGEGGDAKQMISDPMGDHVIALFPTKKEALECVRIKQSFGRDGRDEGEGSGNDRFLVRRRWNV